MWVMSYILYIYYYEAFWGSLKKERYYEINNNLIS
jgi:hypothetical protein